MSEQDVDPRIARTREVVLTSVLELLRTEGLDAVTHTRVAEVSGVGRATLYRHWPDAGGLLVDAVRHGQGSARAFAELPDLPLAQAVRFVVSRLAAVLVEDAMFPIMLALVERAEHDPAYAEVRERLTTQQAAPIDALLRRAQEDGDLDASLDLEHAKALLVGPLFFSRIVGRPLAEDQLDAHVAIWLRAVGGD